MRGCGTPTSHASGGSSTRGRGSEGTRGTSGVSMIWQRPLTAQVGSRRVRQQGLARFVQAACAADCLDRAPAPGGWQHALAGGP